MTTPKYKHFKFEDRYMIQEFLKLNYSFTAIRFKPYKPPYVYNGCPDKTSRSQSQYICETSIAHSEYENDTNVVLI